MSGVILAVDTSNYTTSAALCDGREVINTASRLLPVEKGHLGLRQSEAVFHHTRALPEIIGEAVKDGAKIDAVAVSSRPRDVEGSYMPCFLAGLSTAKSIGAVCGVPVYEFSTSRGILPLPPTERGDLIFSKRNSSPFIFRGAPPRRLS